MLALLSGKLSIIVYLSFPVLVVGALVLQHFVTGLRRELDMAAYELERGPIKEAPAPPPPEKLLPGYTMLTFDDYKELRDQLLKEFTAKQV